MTVLLQDKKAIFQLFAGLMANPDVLGNTREYKLTTDDFPESFHKIVFGAMYNLQSQGIERITRFEVDNALSEFPNQYRIYNENNGHDYLEKIEELGQPENFDLHYARVKKYSFLRSCVSKGISISHIYDHTLIDINESEAQQKLFNSTKLEDMIKEVESKMLEIKDEFLFGSENMGSHMSDNLREIVAEKMMRPSYGAGFSSKLFTAATRGARIKKVFLNSAPSGVGKSRFAISSMLSICVPEIWNSETNQWELTGARGRCLYIGTELEEDEVKIPAICYIADVDEDKIQDATLTDAEKKRLKKAIKILEKTPFWFEQLHDFDLADIEHVITKNINKHSVSYVAYDYIHTSMKILSSMGKLQEHQILLQMSIKLKELANRLSVFLMTSTQLNGDYKEGDMDDNSLSGAKSIAQKVDIGSIMLNVNVKDEDIITSIMGGQGENDGVFGERPNMSINLYKNRGNKWKLVRLWIYFNLSTLRIHDCFATDYRGNLIPHLKPLSVVFNDIEEISLSELPIHPYDEVYQTTEETEQQTEVDSLPDAFNQIEPTAQEFNF